MVADRWDVRARTVTDGTDGRTVSKQGEWPSFHLTQPRTKVMESTRHTLSHTRPRGDLPAQKSALVGWPVMALFAEYEGQPYSEQEWHEGVVVRYDDEAEYPYLMFFEMDSVWEPTNGSAL